MEDSTCEHIKRRKLGSRGGGPTKTAAAVDQAVVSEGFSLSFLQLFVIQDCSKAFVGTNILLCHLLYNKLYKTIFFQRAHTFVLAWFFVLQTETKACGPKACASNKAGRGRKENKLKKHVCLVHKHIFYQQDYIRQKTTSLVSLL